MEQFPIWKLFDKVLAPFQQSYVELAAFLALCILATAALVVRRRRQLLRSLVQLVSLVVFFFVVSSCLGVFGLIRNGFLGLRLLSEQDDLGAFYWLAMTVVALSATFVGGAVFCGWICPTGTLQEWAGWVGKRVRGWVSGFGFRVSGLEPESPVCLSRQSDSCPTGTSSRDLKSKIKNQKSKIGLALWSAVIVAYLVVAYRAFSGRRPILEDSATLWAGSLSVLVGLVLLAPRSSQALKRFRWVSLLVIVGFTLAGVSVFSPVHFIFMNVGDWASFLSGLVIVGAAFFVLRAWCRYLCPFGVVCGWAARHAVFRIEKVAGCSRCGICARVCEVEAVADGEINLSSCIACMKCVDNCPEGTLALVARPFGERADEPASFEPASSR